MLAGQQVGPFTVEREIGAGAMGTVFRARYTKNDQPVAIKIVSGGLDTNSQAVARFEREAIILKKLEHPNIVRLYGTGRYKKTPFYVMEFVNGETLEAILARRGRFTWEEVVELGKQVCAALQHAHGHGIVHRDLKPANIMLTADGTAKLTDFGIAKGLELSQLTATNCTVGTAAYMSPEQCRGEKDLSPKSDLYSLGVMFYELLTGRRPFQAETTLDMFLAHTEGKFERPSRLVLEIPVWLDTLVCQLLEKKPEKRPYDAATVAQALERVAEKVTAQRSAGVDAVSVTAFDRPKAATKTDQTDLEAARTLRTATRKKLTKKPSHKAVPGWVPIVGSVAILAALGWLTYDALRPPSPGQLYEKARKLMTSSDPDDRDRARQGPIKDYLAHYGDRSDEQATQVKAWADEFDVAQKEQVLRNRMRMRMTPDDEAETVAQNAVRSEEAGEPDLAAEKWAALAQKYSGAADRDQAVYALLAEKRGRELKAARDAAEDLRQRVARARYTGQPVAFSNQSEQSAVKALQYEQFGDLPAAVRRWQQLKEATQTDATRRAWFLLAAKKVTDLKPKAGAGDDVKARLELIQAKLKKAEETEADDPEESRAVCTDIESLYGTDPDGQIAAAVDAARKYLAEHPARQKAP